MKKIILSLVILTTTFFVSQAQVNVGVKGGIGMFNFSGDDAEDFKSKIGPMGGVYAAIPLGETFAVAPELQFSGQGAKMEVSSIKVNYNLNYLNIPVMFQYRNPSGFVAETGPQIGFLMSAKAKMDGEEEDVKDSFKGNAFSWGVGLGYKSSMGVGIAARYNINLNSIVDDDEGESVDVKNSGFQIGVFFEFGGKSGNARR